MWLQLKVRTKNKPNGGKKEKHTVCGVCGGAEADQHWSDIQTSTNCSLPNILNSCLVGKNNNQCAAQRSGPLASTRGAKERKNKESKLSLLGLKVELRLNYVH